MLDILLNDDNDLSLTDDGDIRLAYSIPQAISVRLKWISGEWRLGPEYGFPWFTDVFKKNPDTALIAQKIRSEILDVDGVNDAKVDLVTYDVAARTISFRYRAYTDTEEFVEEVVLSV